MAHGNTLWLTAFANDYSSCVTSFLISQGPEKLISLTPRIAMRVSESTQTFGLLIRRLSGE